MEKQKTAVQWLIDEIENIPFQCPEVTDYYNDVIALFDQAKQMEKEQIIEAWLNGYHKCGCKQPKQGSKYYLETYGKHENKAENND